MPLYLVRGMGKLLGGYMEGPLEQRGTRSESAIPGMGIQANVRCTDQGYLRAFV